MGCCNSKGTFYGPCETIVDVPVDFLRDCFYDLEFTKATNHDLDPKDPMLSIEKPDKMSWHVHRKQSTEFWRVEESKSAAGGYVFDIAMYGAMNGAINMPAGRQYKGQGGARRSVEECQKAPVFKLHWQSELTPAGSEKTKMVDTGSDLWLKGYWCLFRRIILGMMKTENPKMQAKVKAEAERRYKEQEGGAGGVAGDFVAVS